MKRRERGPMVAPNHTLLPRLSSTKMEKPSRLPNVRNCYTILTIRGAHEPFTREHSAMRPIPPRWRRKLGRGEILVKHVPRWMLALGTRPAGAAVRALAWIRPAHADESLASLHRTLPRAEWKALTSARATLPSWMAQAIGKEAAHG